MKGYRRHRDWTEWGKQRALYHQNQAAMMEMMNASIHSVMSKPYVWDMSWPILKPYAPFYTGSEIRVPFRTVEIEGV